jgi:hypothetical protein
MSTTPPISAENSAATSAPSNFADSPAAASSSAPKPNSSSSPAEDKNPSSSTSYPIKSSPTSPRHCAAHRFTRRRWRDRPRKTRNQKAEARIKPEFAPASAAAGSNDQRPAIEGERPFAHSGFWFDSDFWFRISGFRPGAYSTTASASISISASASISFATSTIAVAGRIDPNISP